MDRAAFGRKIRLGMSRVEATAADIAFADPPYAMRNIEAVPEIIAAAAPFSERGMMVIQHGRQTRLPESAGDFRKCEVRLYGQTALTFFRLRRPPG